MTGTIIQVNTSLGGLPKRPVSNAFITPLGIAGDRHAHPAIHGGPRKAILIVASEAVDQLTERGYPLFYGALGENLTTRGLTIRDNLPSVVRHWHRIKTFGGWTITRHGRGWQWTSPHGRSYTTGPYDYRLGP